VSGPAPAPAPDPTAAAAIAGDATPPTTALPWSEAATRLAAAHVFWLGTLAPGGRPQSRPVLAVWVDGRLYSTAGPGSRKARNLATNPRLSLSTTTEGMDLVIEGRAEPVTGDDRLAAVGAAYRDKYGWPVEVVDGAFAAPYGAPTAGPPPYEVYEIVPEVAYGFGTDETWAPRSTRWRFPA
jgi:nitroimidazol reductase NimA-like FMN-containing flavoprotein (pyridoxamine 5'-phosphate oxidase superfamily)